MLKTIHDPDFEIKSSDLEFKYQEKLTAKLDALDADFDQEIINEIVLWKVNRYAAFSSDTLGLLNQLSKSSQFDPKLTREILRHLLNEKGIQLPMASTILRFKNPSIYQIIDQRVYRFIYGNELKLSTTKNTKNIQQTIELYLTYLSDLREVAFKHNFQFEQADRILYEIDKRVNKTIKLKNYGTTQLSDL
jgi:hypothetical protein